MLALTPLFRSLRHRIFRFIIKVSVLKPLPNIFHRHSRRMYHIIGIETVVTQFIHHDFVGGEIRPSPHPPCREGVVTLPVCFSMSFLIGRDTTPSLQGG